jgi:NitT/TauT family transport system substrate-binding protein
MHMRFSFITASALGLGFVASVAPVARAADTVRVGVPAVYPTYAVLYAAKELGFYAERNIDTEITLFRGGPATQEALAAGSIDISGIAPGAASLAIAKGVREKIVALFAPATPAGWHIMVPAASPIKSMADLNGKTVGVTQKASLTDFWVELAAKQSGIAVRTVPLGGAGVMPGLRAKQVDAAILWPLFSYKGLLTAEFRSIYDLDARMKPSVSEGWAVTEELIEKHPDVVRRWLAADSKAVIYMQAHPDWSIDFLARYFDEPDKRVSKMVLENFIMKIRPDGTMDPEWMQDALDLAAASGIKVLPPDKIFTAQFLPVRVE